MRTLAHQARKVADDLDLALSGSSIRKLVRQFLAGGRGDLRSFVITYADPTGETAIHNILTKRRRT